MLPRINRTAALAALLLAGIGAAAVEPIAHAQAPAAVEAAGRLQQIVQTRYAVGAALSGAARGRALLSDPELLGQPEVSNLIAGWLRGDEEIVAAVQQFDGLADALTDVSRAMALRNLPESTSGIAERLVACDSGVHSQALAQLFNDMGIAVQQTFGDTRPFHSGTSGLRAWIGDDITFPRIRQYAAGHARFLKEQGATGPVIIGYDRRFQSQEFAREAARVIAAAGLPVVITDKFVPTPAISQAVAARHASGGVVITASHNPFQYNGYKQVAPHGGPASTDVTDPIDRYASELSANLVVPEPPTFQALVNRGLIQEVNLYPEYLASIRRNVDVERIAESNIKVILNPMYGAGTCSITKILGEAGKKVEVINGTENPGFGGVQPEPVAENLKPLMDAVEAADGSEGPVIGIAHDADADRLGVVVKDPSGHAVFFDNHKVSAVVLKHLVDHRGAHGSLVHSVTVSSMVPRLAESYGMETIQTKVGFPTLSGIMVERGDVVMATEESGGLAVGEHIPDRDGAMAGLLLLEAVAVSGKTPLELLAEVEEITGAWEMGTDNIDLPRGTDTRAQVADLNFRMIAGKPVVSVNELDGKKFIMEDGSWVVVRGSGTEPLVRIRVNAPGANPVEAQKRVQAMLADVRAQLADQEH